MRKSAFVLSFALLVTSVAASALAQAVPGEGTLRIFQPVDRGLQYTFDYPLTTHSVRTSNLQLPPGEPIVAGGLIAVEPNDSALYADGAEPDSYTQMRVLALPMGDSVPDDLTSLPGTLPLLTYDPTEHDGLTVTPITLDGEPALRVDGIGFAPGSGVSEIIAAYDGILYEIVLEPVPVGMSFENFDVTIDPVIETVLASWQFVPLE